MNADPIKAMLQASQNGPYDSILEAARQLDAGWLTRQNKRIDTEIREVLKLHPAWPVVEAIEAGLKDRAGRIKAQKQRADTIDILVNPTRDYQKPYRQALSDMAYDLEAHVAQFDRMDLRGLTAARRSLASAMYDIYDILSDAKNQQEAAA